MFGFVFKSITLFSTKKWLDAYLPWVIVVYSVLTGANDILSYLVGIAAGHTYIVLKDVVPNSQYKYNILQTPKFL